MARLILALTLLSFQASCSLVEPYERGKLAHPTMTDARLDGPAAAHVTSIHEGATGGGRIFGSGCGCN
jgi:hypothetical protein